MIEFLTYAQENNILIQLVLFCILIFIYHIKVSDKFLTDNDKLELNKQILSIKERLDNNYYRVSETYNKVEVNSLVEDRATEKDILHIQEMMETRFTSIETHVTGINQRINEIKGEFHSFSNKLDQMLIDRQSS